jgi:hypothetical protein
VDLQVGAIVVVAPVSPATDFATPIHAGIRSQPAIFEKEWICNSAVSSFENIYILITILEAPTVLQGLSSPNVREMVAMFVLTCRSLPQELTCR